MSQQEIEQIIKGLQALPKECEWVEFKVNNSNPQEIGEYISALANSACYHNQQFAYLVFGVENETHKIVGTSYRPKLDKIKGQEIENWIATQLEPRIDFEIIETNIDGKNIALFKIDAARHTPVKFKREAFIRIGSYTKPLQDHQERERKIWKKVDSVVFEKEIAKASLTADQVIELIDYPKFFELLNQKLPENKNAIIEKLEQDKLINKKHDKFDITNLGAVLFARDISKFDNIARKAVRVIIYEKNNKVKTIKEHTDLRGYAICFDELVNYINDKLPSNEEIGKAFRKEIRMYPSLVIRELVANAIIHQDFSIKGTSTMVEIFQNRIEITNAGKPLIDPLRFIDHSPESRNEMLAAFMRRIKICEERGSGIDKVVSDCELYQLPAPDFIAGDNFTRIVLYSPKSLREMDRKDKIRACYQHCCLRYVSGEHMTNESLRERFKIESQNYSTVSRIIAATMEAKLIKDYDPDNKSRKYAKYLPIWA